MILGLLREALFKHGKLSTARHKEVPSKTVVCVVAWGTRIYVVHPCTPPCRPASLFKIGCPAAMSNLRFDPRPRPKIKKAPRGGLFYFGWGTRIVRYVSNPQHP